MEALLDLGNPFLFIYKFCFINDSYLVVDRVLEVVDTYQARILKLERNIILNPNMDSVRCRKYNLLHTPQISNPI
jgi:hypothetical protein